MADVESLELQITGDVQKAKKSINSLIGTLDKLKKATSGGCGLGAVSKELGKFSNTSIKFSSATGSSAKSLANLGTKAVAAVYSLKKVTSVIGSWVTESNNYVENVNLFTVSMGKYAESAQQYAEHVSDIMGIDPSTWMRNQGVFMTLGTGFGVAADRAATMSQQLTQLGYDMSSFFNISVEDAMQKLQSGISGELEPLRRLGYDLSQAKLEATALSLGIDKSVSSMTQAEKAELRYYAIMTQVTTAQGDMARTLEAPANQVRIFKAQLTQAGRALGNIFIPALNAVLPYAIAALKVVRLLANAIASLVGFTLPEVDYSSVSDGVNDTASGLEEATENAKKFKKMLLGIDELNVMSDKDSADDESVGGGFGFELPTYDFIGDASNSKINEIVEKMKEWLGITGEIKSWSDLFDTRLGDILTNVGLIGVAFAGWKLTKGFLNAIGIVKTIIANPKLSLTIGATVAIVGFKIMFDGAEEAITKGLDGFNFGEILGGGLLGAGGAALLGSKLATWISTAFAGSAVDLVITQAGINLGVGTAGAAGAALAGSGAAVVAGLTAFFVGVWDSVVNGIDWWSGILTAVGGAAAGAGVAVILTALGTAVAPGVGTLIGLAVGVLVDGIILLVQKWEAVSAWISQACADVGQFFVDLWNGIVSVWNVVAPWFDTNVIQPVVGFFVTLWEGIKTAATVAWGAIKTVWNVVCTWFNTYVIQPVVIFFVGLWNGISSAASACWDAIVAFFSPAIQWFSALFSSVWQTISDIFYNIGVIASGCWQIIKAVWGIVSAWFNTNVIQPVCNFFTNLWNGIKTTATNAWTGIKSVFSTIGSWMNQYVIQPVCNFFTNLWNGVKSVATSAWNGIKTVYGTVKTWFNTNIIQPVGTFFSNLWNGFINGAKTAWAGVKSVFGAVGNFFKTTFQNAWAGIVKVFSVAGSIFTDIKNAIVTAFKSVVNGLIKGLNKVVSVPFNGINKALMWLKDLNILGLKPFTSLKEINVPQIPLLAEGGMVSSGQMFIAREAGPEMVGSIGNRTAVANNDQIVSAVSQGVYKAVVQAMAQSSGDQVVEARVNDKVLFEAVLNRNRLETMRKGFNPLVGGV